MCISWWHAHHVMWDPWTSGFGSPWQSETPGPVHNPFSSVWPGIESLYSQCSPAEKSLSALRSDLIWWTPNTSCKDKVPDLTSSTAPFPPSLTEIYLSVTEPLLHSIFYFLFTHTHLTSIFSLAPLSSQSPSSHLADKWFNPSHPQHGCDIILLDRTVVSCVYDGVSHAFVCVGAALVSIVLSKILLIFLHRLLSHTATCSILQSLNQCLDVTPDTLMRTFLLEPWSDCYEKTVCLWFSLMVQIGCSAHLHPWQKSEHFFWLSETTSEKL